MNPRRLRLPLCLLLAWEPLALAQSDWPNVGNDKGATRYSTLARIDRRSVKDLEVAWTFHTGGLDPAVRNSAIQCTPIVVGGVMYLTSPDTQVIAVDAATGVERWRFDPGRGPRHRGLYNRGVAYWSDAGHPGRDAQRILFATPDGVLYSLDARTGKLDPAFGHDGTVDLRTGIERNLRTVTYGATSAPAVFDDLVILGFSLDEGSPAAPTRLRGSRAKLAPSPRCPTPASSPSTTWERTPAACLRRRAARRRNAAAAAGAPLPWRRATEIGAAIADALAAAPYAWNHAPRSQTRNVFLTADGHTKVLDFGLARLRPAVVHGDSAVPTAAVETDAGTVLGTVGYMSPEQVRGETAEARPTTVEPSHALHLARSCCAGTHCEPLGRSSVAFLRGSVTPWRSTLLRMCSCSSCFCDEAGASDGG